MSFIGWLSPLLVICVTIVMDTCVGLRLVVLILFGFDCQSLNIDLVALGIKSSSKDNSNYEEDIKQYYNVKEE